MFINTAWSDNPVWMFGTESIIHITSINGESLIDREVEELQEIIPGIIIKELYIEFRTDKRGE